MTGTRTSEPGAGGYLRIRIGRTQFLVPVTERIQVDPEHADMPVLSIDETLHPAAGTAAACRVVLGSGAERVAVACDAADLVGPDGVKLYPLPPCMHGPDSVFSAAASLGDNIHGVCDAEILRAALVAPAAPAGDAP